MKLRHLVTALLVTGSGPALAADWTLDPRVSLGYVYDDNYRMAEDPSDKIEVSGAEIDAQLTMQAETPRSRLRLTPRVRSRVFPGDASEESDDWFIRMRARHAAERAAATLNFDYSSIAIRGRYFPSTDIDDDDVLGDPGRGVGIGRAGLDDRQNRLAVTPGMTFELNERRSIEAAVSYLDVTYDVQVPGDRVDYQDLYGSIALTQALSPTSSLALRVGHSSYDPDGGSKRESQGIDAEWRRRPFETAEIFVRAGVNRVELDSLSGSGTQWDSGFMGGAGVRWAFEVTDFWFEASRNLDPNSSGDIVTRDQLRAEVSRRLAPMTRISLGARLMMDSATAASPEFRDRTYAAGSLGFDWRFARQWLLFGTYEYKWREYEDAARNAQAHTVNFGITYEPNRR